MTADVEARVSPEWSEILKEARESLRSAREDPLIERHLSLSLRHVDKLVSSIRAYVFYLKQTRNENRASVSDVKKLILSTRNALRFALCCFAVDHDDRYQLQTVISTTEVSVSLVEVISSKRGDSKCRTLAARFLSNLVTSNATTASRLVSMLPLSPSEDDIDAHIRSTVSDTHYATNQLALTASWVSLLLSNAGDRETLAAVVTSLHNCIVSLASGSMPSFSRDVSSDRLLISTLLRQLLSMQALKGSLGQSDTSVSQDDPATEWILILLMKLCRMGRFPELYRAAGPGKDIVPEQIVLLHAIRSEQNGDNILGREAGSKAMLSSHMFLANLYVSIQQVAERDSNDTMQHALVESVILSVVDILGEGLGTDTVELASVRACLGTETELVRSLAINLGVITDTISVKNQERKVRELDMSVEEQHLITSLVRLIGNLCYQCRDVQDLLRTTLVPPIDPVITKTERSALHVLLSCTSLAHSCFTLREWAVVAIRNALHQNDLNMAVVANLEAQQALQTSALGELGIRVNLDTKGNVSVSPAEPAIEEIDD